MSAAPTAPGAGPRGALGDAHLVIFGGSSGIGLATATRASAAGARVTIVGRDPERLSRAAAALPGAATMALDATDRAALDRSLPSLAPIDHLILSVATGAGAGAFATLDLRELRRAVEGKLFAYLETLQAALPHLGPAASVVMVTAASSRMAAPGTAGLAASNGALAAAVPTLAAELAPVRVNAVSPGIVATAIFDRWPPELRARFLERTRTTPVGRPGLPEEVADAILLCCANAFMTGAILDCDGGARLRPG